MVDTPINKGASVWDYAYAISDSFRTIGCYVVASHMWSIKNDRLFIIELYGFSQDRELRKHFNSLCKHNLISCVDVVSTFSIVTVRNMATGIDSIVILCNDHYTENV